MLFTPIFHLSSIDRGPGLCQISALRREAATCRAILVRWRKKMLVENKARNVSQIPKMRASRSRHLLILLAVAAALALPSACYADELPAPSFTLDATGAIS